MKYSRRLGEDCNDLQKALELFLGVPNRATDNKFLASIEGFRGNIYKLGRLLTHDWFTVTDQEGRTKDRYLFLFKARILVCKVKRISEDRSVFVLKDIIKLPEVEVKEVTGEPLKFELRQKNPPLDLILGAHKEHVKNTWLAEINKHASDIVALAEHAADDLQVLQAVETKETAEEKKKKREHTEEVIVKAEQEVKEKRSRTEDIEVTQVSVKEETSQQVKVKRKASVESTVATKISKSEVVEVSSLNENQESAVSAINTEVRSDVTTDLKTKSSVTVSALNAETEPVTSQSESQQTLKTEHTEAKVEEQIVQASQTTEEYVEKSIETTKK